MQATIHNTAFNPEQRELVYGFAQAIVGYYEGATPTQAREGRVWYRYAQDFAADVAHQCGISMRHAAYVIAVLSNNVTWERQVKSTVAFIKHVLNGGDPAQGFGFVRACQLKAAEILLEDKWDALKGPKVTIFAKNILGDYREVTVDRHALRVCLQRHTTDEETTYWTRDGSIRRKMIEAAYHLAAEWTREQVAVLQAVSWTAYRGVSGF